MLKEKALIVTLKISTWMATKKDPEVTNKVNHDYEAHNSGSFTKNLIKSSVLDEVKKISSEARVVFNSLTLPWFNDGSRILPSQSYFRFAAKMDELKVKYENKVQSFLNHYQYSREGAKARLGKMFNPDDYPSQQELERKFNFKVILTPFPDSNDFRIDLSEAERFKIKQDLEKQIQKTTEDAMRSLYQRIDKAVSKMRERLSDPDNKFKNSLVGNLKDIVEVLPYLNIKNDPELNNLLDNIKNNLLVDPDDLRSDKNLRKNTADKADALLKKINALNS